MRPSLPVDCGLFADKAYFHHETRQECKERGFFLVAAYKRHRHEPERDVPTLYNRFVSAIRQSLESLFGWIIQQTDLRDASRVRSTQGLKLHSYGKLALACLLLTLYPDSHILCITPVTIFPATSSLRLSTNRRR